MLKTGIQGDIVRKTGNRVIEGAKGKMDRIGLMISDLKNFLYHFDLTAEWHKESQKAFEYVVNKWLDRKPGKSAQYRTDGENIYYYDSHVVKRTGPNTFAINNQGYSTSTTAKIFNTLFLTLRLPFYVFRRGGEMFLGHTETDEEFLFPTKEWIKYDVFGNLISRLPYAKKIKVLPSNVISEMMKEIRIKMRLLKDKPEEILQIKIPGTNYRIYDLIDDLLHLRRVYLIVYKSEGPEAIFTDILTSEFVEDDIRKIIRDKIMKGEWDIQDITKKMGL